MTSFDVASSSNRYVSGNRNPSVPLPVGEVGVERPVRVLRGGQEPILRDAQRLVHALRDLRQPVALGDRQPCRRHRRRRRGQHEQRLVERHVRGQGVAARSDLVGLAGAPQQDPPHEPVAPQDAEVVQLRDDLLPRRPGLHGERHVVLRAARLPCSARSRRPPRPRRPRSAGRRPAGRAALRAESGRPDRHAGPTGEVVPAPRAGRIPSRRRCGACASARRVEPGLEDDGRRGPVDHVPPLPAGRRPPPAARARPPRWRGVRPAARPGRLRNERSASANALGLDGGRARVRRSSRAGARPRPWSPRARPPAWRRPSGPPERRCGSCRAAPPSAGRRRRSRPRSARRPDRDRARGRAD